MPEYLHPGVYIEEQPAPQTIEGVSTSTAGFAGATEKGPTGGLPVLVTSFAEFRRIFGGYLSRDTWGESRFLPHAVEGFFANGGQRVYIKRVIDETSDEAANAATVMIGDGFVTRLREDTTAEEDKRHVVRLVSMRGVDTTAGLEFTQGSGTEAITQSRAVVAYRSEVGGTVAVTLNAPLTYRFTREGCTVTIFEQAPPNGENATRGLQIEAASKGAWGNTVEIATFDADGATGLTASNRATSSTALVAIPADLAFTSPTAGPLVGAENVVLRAGDGAKLRHDDLIEFRNPDDQRDVRRISKNGDTISWAGDGPDQGPLTFGYSAADSTVSLLTAIRGPVELAFAESGPEADALEATLSVASAAKLDVGDVVEFRSSTNGVARVTVTDIDPTNGAITWADPIGPDFTSPGSTGRRVTDAPAILVDQVTGFAPSDLLRLDGENGGTIVAISADIGAISTANGTITLDTTKWAIEAARLPGDVFTSTGAATTGALSIELRSVQNFYGGAVVEIDDGRVKHYHVVERIDGQNLVLTEPLSSSIPTDAAVRAVEFTLRVDVDGEPTTEIFPNLSLSPEAANYVAKVITAESSRLVRVSVKGEVGTPPFHLPRTDKGQPMFLATGADGGIPSLGDYRGVDGGPNQRSGIKALADIDQISIIAAPGIADASVHNELIEQCSLLKDRFAVIDPRPGSSIGGAANLDIGTQRGQYDTLYAAMYYPWMKIPDPMAPPDRPATMDVPPSGHIVGLYARVDVERGVHKAPANEVVRGITGLELKLTDRDQDILNPLHVNVIRDFRDNQRGLRVWGSRCLTSDSAWKYVPVRRLFIFIEESLDEGLQWVVFEPNDERLWARVRQTVSGFLRRIWRDGALAGVTEDEAFFVRCDRTTMTEDDLRSGRLIILVAARPVFPAEFVIVRISQKTLEAAS